LQPRSGLSTIPPATQRLKRFQFTGDLHFVTFSCHGRQPYLASIAARIRFEEALERTRSRYGFCVLGYVVMPEHVHLLVSEPTVGPLAKALHALKLSVAKLSPQRPFGQARYAITRPENVGRSRLSRSGLPRCARRKPEQP